MTAATVERPHGAQRHRNQGCNCRTCRYDYAREQAAVRQLKKAGQWRPWVEGDSVRTHVLGLVAAGFTRQAIATAGNVDQKTIVLLLDGKGSRPPTRLMRTAVARRILAVTADSPKLAIAGLQPTLGCVRRIQALCAIGWSLPAQAARIGWGARNHQDFLSQKWVQPSTAARIRRLYGDIAMTFPDAGQSATRARKNALRKGWFPPLAWDDIDDPAALPCLMPPVDGSDPDADELQIQHWAAGHTCQLSRVEEVEIVRRLIADSVPFSDISKRLRRSPTWVGYVRRELDGSAAAESRNSFPASGAPAQPMWTDRSSE